jgi:hypothetical protein
VTDKSKSRAQQTAQVKFVITNKKEADHNKRTRLQNQSAHSQRTAAYQASLDDRTQHSKFLIRTSIEE